MSISQYGSNAGDAVFATFALQVSFSKSHPFVRIAYVLHLLGAVLFMVTLQSFHAKKL